MRSSHCVRSRVSMAFTAQGAIVEMTPWAVEAMTSALRCCGATQVHALLGTTRARAAGRAGAPLADYADVDVGRMQMSLDANITAVNRPRIVYLSATNVREDSSNAYIRARGQVEASLRRGSLLFTGQTTVHHRPGPRRGAANGTHRRRHR